MPTKHRLAEKKPEGVTESRDSKGRFAPGNHCGIWFDFGNTIRSAYTEDMPQRVIEYFSRPYLHTGQDVSGKTYYWADRPPSLVRFALEEAHVLTKTLYAWRKDHPEFDEACNVAEELVQQQLIDCGLNKAYNVTMAKFVLSARHGMVEKTAVDNSVKLEIELPEDLNTEAD